MTAVGALVIAIWWGGLGWSAWLIIRDQRRDAQDRTVSRRRDVGRWR